MGDPTPRPRVPQPPGPGLPPQPEEPRLPPSDPEPELPGFPEPADLRPRLARLNQDGFGVSIRNWFATSRIGTAAYSRRPDNDHESFFRKAVGILSPGILHHTLLTFNYLLSL
jgi:hypothetical protein